MNTNNIKTILLLFLPLIPLYTWAWNDYEEINKGNFGKIALTDEQGKKVEGSASISDMTLSVQPEAKHLTPGDEITLTCSAPEATIYYSIDGAPTTRYEGPIRFEGDMTLQAVAMLDGYYDTDLLTKEYLRSVEIASKYPSEPLYNYADVNPSLTYSYPIERGAAFSGITMRDVDGKEVDCLPLIQGTTLFIVPEKPLQDGMLYTVTLPAGALLVTNRGEESQAYTWTFAAGNYATAVSAGGPELMAALKSDGSLWTWGQWLTTANSDDGSYSYTLQTEPASFVAGDVVAVSSGYTHHALIKRDGSLWMWGRQLCGEFGNGSREASAKPVKVMDGVRQVSCGLQTTAIVKDDGTLWMCGRNDLGQIDATRTVYTSYILLGDGVSQVSLNWGSITIEKTDGTTETRTWDEDTDDGRLPTGNGLSDAAQVAYGWKDAVALGEDGSVWTWGEGYSLQEMIEGRNPQALEGISLLAETLTMKAGEKAVVAMRPVPLLANYESVTWESSSTHVAEVSERGVVTAVSDGETKVTATIADAFGKSYEATCMVTVGDPPRIADMASDWTLRVVAKGRQLTVSGMPEGQTVSVFSLAGMRVYHGSMPDSPLTIALPQQGVYVVKAAGQTRKLTVR